MWGEGWFGINVIGLSTMFPPAHLCSEWYDSEAFLLNEEGMVMSGLLMGLNVIDYNVIMKGEDYDRPVSMGGTCVGGRGCTLGMCCVCVQGSQAEVTVDYQLKC